MDVLRGKVVVQHAGGARVAVLAAHAVKQGAAHLVEGGDYFAVLHGQRDLPLLKLVGVVGVEELGFDVEIARQLGVGGGHAVLHGAVRQNKMQQQGVAAVEQRAAQNQQGVGIPNHAVVDGEDGVERHHQRAEGDGAVAQADGAGQGKHEGEQRHRGQKQQRLAERKLHGKRGDAEGGNGGEQILNAAGEAVV